ncbi:MAG: hypothetical protein WC494_02690 [Candidatus Pacearchaeota archaeon]
MDPLKEAFNKIKEDIVLLNQNISFIKSELSIQAQKIDFLLKEYSNSDKPTDKPTQNTPLEPLKAQNNEFSTGNRGVPTDRQTNQQTDKPTQKPIDFHDFSRAGEILNSLDSIKKEIRLKFKRLTTQEMVVFSKLYTLEDENIPEITYRTLSLNLDLSESSIRDYINKLIKKGIPIQKIKLNNKTILLKISPDLRNIVTLSKIIQLREL